MIELQKVTKEYEGTTAVQELSLRVEPGEVCVLIGPSGSGKSTVIRLINRLLEPTRGVILIRNRDVKSFRPEILRRQIGYVIQNVGLFPHMTVAENIAVVPSLLRWDRPRVNRRVDELLRLVALEPRVYRAKLPHELSGGEAQRIGVARALASDPPILLMDEPFGAVDPLNRETLQEEFIRIQKELKKTVVFVTHDLDEAIRVADRVALMRSGRIVQYDSPEDLLAKPADDFARSFVGTDRALKRLVRFQAGDFMHAAPALRLPRLGISDTSTPPLPEEDSPQAPRFRWVVSERDEPIGWVDIRRLRNGSRLEDVMTPIQAANLAVYTYSTLKAALSRMLGQGVQTIPVIDRQNRLVGEISLHEIEKVTEETRTS